jgi:hypothetical protein
VNPLPSDARRAVSLLYLAGVIVILEQLAEILALIYPFHTAVASWRFGLLGITVSRTGSLALADVMILGAAILLEHRAFLRFAGIMHLLGAIVLLPAMGVYTLDTLVLRRALKPEYVRGFDLTAVRTMLTCSIGFVAGVLIFWSTWRLKPVRTEKDPSRDVLIAQTPVKELK